jgi:hypothetical protein
MVPMESPTLGIEDTEKMHNTNMSAPLENMHAGHMSFLAGAHAPRDEKGT